LKFQMPENSLFATLLRKPWWVSLAIGVAVGAVAAALLPASYRVVGALSGFPFIAIAAMAAWRGRGQPGPAQVEQAAKTLGAMNWPAFEKALEAAFQRDGFTVKRSAGSAGGACDFDIERKGRRMLVAARRWKSAHTGLEPLRALQAAREAADAPDALFICLGDLSEPARKLVTSERIAVWQAAELTLKLRGLLPAG
jgi:restriction system protein